MGFGSADQTILRRNYKEGLVGLRVTNPRPPDLNLTSELSYPIRSKYFKGTLLGDVLG